MHDLRGFLDQTRHTGILIQKGEVCILVYIATALKSEEHEVVTFIRKEWGCFLASLRNGEVLLPILCSFLDLTAYLCPPPQAYISCI